MNFCITGQELKRLSILNTRDILNAISKITNKCWTGFEPFDFVLNLILYLMC